MTEEVSIQTDTKKNPVGRFSNDSDQKLATQAGLGGVELRGLGIKRLCTEPGLALSDDGSGRATLMKLYKRLRQQPYSGELEVLRVEMDAMRRILKDRVPVNDKEREWKEFLDALEREMWNMRG